MPYLKQDGLSHRDWFVQVGRVGPAFGFRCHHTVLGSHTDGLLYLTWESAVIAGCGFIDREQAIAAIAPILDEWMSDEKITIEEYWRLSNFCPDPS